MEKLHSPQIFKTCSACRQTKPVEDFSSNIQNPDGLAYYCRICNATKQREWKRNNKEKIRLARIAYRERKARIAAEEAGLLKRDSS